MRPITELARRVRGEPISISAPRPERTQRTHRTLTEAVEKSTIVQGDVLEIRTNYRPEEVKLVYLAPVQTAVEKGRLHFFTEEEPEGEQTIIMEGDISWWRKVGHRSGHWDKLLQGHLGSNLSSKPLL